MVKHAIISSQYTFVFIIIIKNLLLLTVLLVVDLAVTQSSS